MTQLDNPITDEFSADLGLLHRFAAIDLAPNEGLETGFSVLDRERTLLRIDKFYRDDEILKAIDYLGPANSTAVVIDMPKSLSIPGRWRQEEIKMHPLRLERQDGSVTNRYDARGPRLYDKLEKQGVLVFMYFNYWARVNYEMLLPFRSRSAQGCRALQSTIEHHLAIHNLPNNLPASSILESMIGAYAGWSLWAGQPHSDYEIHADEDGRRILIPKGRPHLGEARRAKKLSLRRNRFTRWQDVVKARKEATAKNTLDLKNQD